MNFAPEFIGVGKYTTELAQFMQGLGVSVEVVTAWPHYPGWRVRTPHPWRYAVASEDGIRVTRCPLVAQPGGRLWRLIAPLTFAAAAAPIVLWRSLRFRPHTVLCVEPTLLAAPAALLGAWLAGAQTVLHVQDLEIDAAFATGYLGSRLLKRVVHGFERLLLKRFGQVVTISEAMAGRLAARGVARDRLRVLRNWVAAAPAIPKPAGTALRDRLRVTEDVRLVLYAGNLGAKQGLPVMVEAARRLRGDPTIRFVVVGDGPLRPRLRAAAASLPNLDVLDLLPQTEFAGLLRAVDLHLLPQDRAASDLVFPSKLGPILASGRPAVVTADRGSELARWLEGAAVLCPPGNGDALAAAVAATLGGTARWDPARAATLAAALDADTILPAFARSLLPRDRSQRQGSAEAPAWEVLAGA